MMSGRLPSSELLCDCVHDGAPCTGHKMRHIGKLKSDTDIDIMTLADNPYMFGEWRRCGR